MANAKNSGGKNRTTEIMGRLINATSIKRFIDKNDSYMKVEPFHEYIRRKCQEKGVVQEHVIKRADIERTYGHQLFRGLRIPSRDKVIQLAFGFGFNVEETQSLLKAACKSALYPKVKRDAVILFCINRGMSVIRYAGSSGGTGTSVAGGGRP